MKKLLTLLFCIALAGMISAQNRPVILFGHSPKVKIDNSGNVCKLKNNTTLNLKGNFVWSFDAVISAFEFTLQKDPFDVGKNLLTGAGFAVGYKHATVVGSEISTDWGVNFAVMNRVNINGGEVINGYKLALLGNYYNAMAGPSYTPSATKGNRFGLILGGSIAF